MAAALNVELGLPEPYPVALGKHESKFGFYIHKGDRFAFFNFHSAYAAKYLIDRLLDGREPKWVNTKTIVIDDLRIRGEGDNDLEYIIEYQLKGNERKWLPPEPYLTYYDLLVSGKRTPPEPTSQPEPSPRAPSEPRPDGLTPLADIAQELGIDPREARQILRKKAEKPAWGWAWPRDAVDKIKALLRKK